MKNLNLPTAFLCALVGFLLAGSFFGFNFSPKPDTTAYLADASNRVGRPVINPDRVVTSDRGEKIVIADKFDDFVDAKFNVTKQVSYGDCYFNKASLIEKSEFEYRPNTLVSNLLRVPGVTDVKLNIYTIEIGIGKAFDSREVTDKIVTVLKDWLKNPTILENDVPKPKERPETRRGLGGYPYYGS